jgi:NAD(P)-dependent dehydrogenase (short-subunit alcohol dehydrogenase family)
MGEVVGHTQGKIALVTGATRGIGLQVAEVLARAGATVLMGARNPSRGAEVAAQVADRTGGQVLSLTLDVTDAAGVQDAASQVEERFGRLDILVNNAGRMTSARVPSEVTADLMREEFETNVFGPVTVMHAFIPLLRRSAHARVVNVSSEAGSLTLMTDPSHPAHGASLLTYNSSKTALNALTVIYGNELRADGISVDAVCPGYVDTDLNEHRGTRSVQDAAQVVADVALATTTTPIPAFVGADGPIPW